MDREIAIRAPAQADRADALSLAFAWETPALRAQRVAGAISHPPLSGTTFDGLFEAVHHNRRIAAIFAQLSPGRIANVWPPGLAAGEDETVAVLLVQELEKHLTTAGVQCAQVLLPIYAERTIGPLLRAGFIQAARLMFLGSEQQQFPDTSPQKLLEFEPYQVDQSSRMISLIDETYLESLDAPFLNGIRTTSEVLDGYRRTGSHLPERWYFVRRQNRDIGCLLLTDHPSTRQFELIYMGLIPAERGRGLGAEIARFAQWQTWLAGRPAIVLGVDEANSPAIAMYARCGFFELDRRLVLIKQLRPS